MEQLEQNMRDLLNGADLGVPQSVVKPVEPPVDVTPKNLVVTDDSPSPAPTTVPSLDEIEKKVELGQELTEIELKAIEDAEKALLPPEPEVKYRVNGEEITYSEAAKRWREETGLGDLDIAKEAEKKNVELWIAHQNRHAFLQNTTQKTQEVSAERKANIENKLREAERTVSEYETRLDEVDAALKTIAADKEEYQRIIAEKPVYDEYTAQDPTKLRAWVRAEQAEEAFSRLVKQEKELIARKQKYADALAKADVQVAKIEVEKFIEYHPQYRTSGDVHELWQKYNRKEELSYDDTIRLKELNDLFRNAANQGITVEEYFSLLKARNALAVKPESRVQTRRLTSPEAIRAEQTLKRVREINRRRAESPATQPLSRTTQVTPLNQGVDPRIALLHEERSVMG